MTRVAVGLSGGVDSAVSALILKRQGFDLLGVHLYCWPPKSETEKDGVTREEWIKKNGCRADEDRQSALKTAIELDIPFRVLDFSEQYNERVIEYFYREYSLGRTPNPDVLCNSEIKFGLFLKWALKNGFDYIATGHYAKLSDGLGNANSFVTRRTQTSVPTRSLRTKGHLPRGVGITAASNARRLFIPKDKHKDQTYFLWKLGQHELKHSLFPLGGLLKSEVRKLAKKAGLSVADRPDSQGICFVGNVDVGAFLHRRLPDKQGDVKDVDGNVIGKHNGVWFFTIGQRGGWTLFAKSQKKFAGVGNMPILYVVRKNVKKNELVVGAGGQVLKRSFEVSDCSAMQIFSQEAVLVRIRHGGKLIPCQITRTKSGLSVILAVPQRGVAPGQSAVFYSQSGECLGGGIID